MKLVGHFYPHRELVEVIMSNEQKVTKYRYFVENLKIKYFHLCDAIEFSYVASLLKHLIRKTA